MVKLQTWRAALRCVLEVKLNNHYNLMRVTGFFSSLSVSAGRPKSFLHPAFYHCIVRGNQRRETFSFRSRIYQLTRPFGKIPRQLKFESTPTAEMLNLREKEVRVAG